MNYIISGIGIFFFIICCIAYAIEPDDLSLIAMAFISGVFLGKFYWDL